MAITGPSGSGKTTLLSLIACMARPTSGRIIVDGETISNLPERFLTEIRRRTFGFIFQQFNLIRGLSARENVVLPAYPTGAPLGRVRREADRLLERLGIGAPVIIVVCSEPQRSERRYGERGRGIYTVHDAVIFAAYIQLALVDLGLSSVWIGAFRQRKVMEILEITDKDLLPVAIIPIGYALDSSLKGKHRRKLVEILYP